MSPADKISLNFPSIKIFRVFLPKGGRSSAFISENVGRSVLTLFRLIPIAGNVGHVDVLSLLSI